jgi:hypothetical protein
MAVAMAMATATKRAMVTAMAMAMAMKRMMAMATAMKRLMATAWLPVDSKITCSLLRLSLEVEVGFVPPKSIEKNSKVGNFPRFISYIEYVLKLKWCGWRDSFPPSSRGPFWGGMRGKKPLYVRTLTKHYPNKKNVYFLYFLCLLWPLKKAKV